MRVYPHWLVAVCCSMGCGCQGSVASVSSGVLSGACFQVSQGSGNSACWQLLLLSSSLFPLQQLLLLLLLSSAMYCCCGSWGSGPAWPCNWRLGLWLPPCWLAGSSGGGGDVTNVAGLSRCLLPVSAPLGGSAGRLRTAVVLLSAVAAAVFPLPVRQAAAALCQVAAVVAKVT